MKREPWTASDGRELELYRWLDTSGEPRGVILISHGMGEHAGRYDALARELCDAGFVVYAPDQRGHGATADPGGLGDLGPGGWRRSVGDLHELVAWIRERHPGLPCALLGHSMGSLLVRQVLVDDGRSIDAAVLSGSTDQGRLRLRLGRFVSRLERWRHGASGESPLLAKGLFADANRDFEPGRTGFEWLSRDPAEVDRYVADPLCGFVLRAGSLFEMFDALVRERRRSERRRIPKGLPIFVLSGDEDPVHRGGSGLARLLREYRSVGLTRVDHHFYPGGRHEMFNETNREEVVADLVAWLRGALDGAAT